MAETNITQDEAKKMKERYINGETINSLAEEFKYTELEVEAVVVKPAEEPEQVTQAQADGGAGDKKGR